MTGLRRRFYISPDVQLPIIVSLILLVTAESFLVGWGFSRAIALARQWDRADQALEFFKVVMLTAVPTVAANFFFGAWLSNKLAGPLERMRAAMNEVARGNLEAELSLRGGDILHAHATDFNRMVQTLRRLIYRDHQHAKETDEYLTRLRERLEASSLPDAEKAELKKLINEAKNRMSIVNAHFLKGKERP